MGHGKGNLFLFLSAQTSYPEIIGLGMTPAKKKKKHWLPLKKSHKTFCFGRPETYTRFPKLSEHNVPNPKS
jgi:hypothetical protein